MKTQKRWIWWNERTKLDEDGNAIEDFDKEDEVDEKKPSECAEWHEEFGPALKMGAIQDASFSGCLMELLGFKLSKNEDSNSEIRTLKDYVNNVKEWKTQNSICQVKTWRLF